MIKRAVLSLTAAGLVSLAARRAGLMTGSGTLAATAVGGAVLGEGGIGWALQLLLFFGTSSALSHWAVPVGPESYVEKGRRRDAVQVMANGALPALAALTRSARLPADSAGLYASFLCAAAADTWATEIGQMGGEQPVMIITGEKVQPGTSGGITPTGTLGALLGSAFMAATSIPLCQLPLRRAALVCAAGFFASLTDSVLGATVQEVHFCDTCNVGTEQRIHALCGQSTKQVGGIPGVTNDAVNLLAVASAGLILLLVPCPPGT